jgi:hypothetical protein
MSVKNEAGEEALARASQFSHPNYHPSSADEGLRKQAVVARGSLSLNTKNEDKRLHCYEGEPLNRKQMEVKQL